jgi:hypothetical protein
MPILSDKYLAGFTDSDGCIGICWRGGKYSPQLTLEWSQKTSQDEVIELIHKQFGGCLSYKVVGGNSYTRVGMKGKHALWILGRIKKHLVVKRSYAEHCISSVVDIGKTSNWKERAIELKEIRKIKSLPLPNFPSRKWMAGYIDGDGSFFATMQRNGLKQSCTCSLSIGCSIYDTAGIEIIQKNFGGNYIKQAGGGVVLLVINLQPTKAKELIGYFGKHLIVKKDQAAFILGVAEKIGHYRDGRKIFETLRSLKAYQHRLSEPKVNVSQLVDEVQDISFRGHWHELKRQSAVSGELTTT